MNTIDVLELLKEKILHYADPHKGIGPGSFIDCMDLIKILDMSIKEIKAREEPAVLATLEITNPHAATDTAKG